MCLRSVVNFYGIYVLNILANGISGTHSETIVPVSQKQSLGEWGDGSEGVTKGKRKEGNCHPGSGGTNLVFPDIEAAGRGTPSCGSWDLETSQLRNTLWQDANSALPNLILEYAKWRWGEMHFLAKVACLVVFGWLVLRRSGFGLVGSVIW